METYYFSFGQDHTHRIDGTTLDADVLLEVEAKDSEEARDRVWRAFGAKWSMQYDEDTVNFNYFPRGSVVIPSI